APPTTAAPTTHAPTTPPPTTSHPATSAPPTSASPSPTPPITVPNVLGESVGTAQQNLIAAGFTKDHINVVYDYQCSARHLGVYAQDPAGGSQVPKGSSVALTAMASSCLLYRDELGADWSKAQADLKSAGFTNVSVVGPNGPCNYGPWGTITAQSPGYQRQYLPSSAAITLTAQSCQIG
ncbi:PASTA domain-containing protein, partial [Streptacidiphilus monticola]